MGFKCTCCEKEHVFENVPDGWIHLEVGGEEYLMQCPHCSPSYLTYKPEVMIEEICVNAGTELCKKCFEPECAFTQETEADIERIKGYYDSLHRTKMEGKE